MNPSEQYGHRRPGYGSSGRNFGNQPQGNDPRGQNEETKSDSIETYSNLGLPSDGPTAQTIRNQREQRQRAEEDQKRGFSRTDPAADEQDATGDEKDRRLTENWGKVCAFFSEQPDNLLGTRKAEKDLGGNRRKFLDACKRLQSNESRSTLTLFQVMNTFQSVFFPHQFTMREYTELFDAIEAWDNPTLETVDFNKILAAPAARCKEARYGLFPKQKPLKSTTGAGESMHPRTEKQVEEEKKQKEAEDAIKKAREDKEKELQRMRTYQAQNARNTMPTPQVFPDPNSGKQVLTKDEQKRKAREEDIRRQQLEAEATQMQKDEAYQVSKEAKEFKKMFSQVMNAFVKNNNQAQVENTLTTFDQKKEKRLDIFDFLKALEQGNKIFVKKEDVQRIHDVLDATGNRKIDYKLFCKAIWNPNEFNVAELIAQNRKRKGQNNGVDPKTAAKLAEASMKGISHPGGSAFGSDRVRGDFEAFSDDMSDIMGLSDGPTVQKSKSIFENTTEDDYFKIRARFREQYNSFEELLAMIQMQYNIKPGEENKITLPDFERLIQNTYTKLEFSAKKIQDVFKRFATNPDPYNTNVQNMYIKVKDFKRIFYPPLEMSNEHKTSKKDRLRQAYLKQSRDSDDDEDFDDDASQKSMLLDDIMQGKAFKKEVEERNEKARQASKTEINEVVFDRAKDSIRDDFEADKKSSYSEQIDMIMGMRPGANDPRKKGYDESAQPTFTQKEPTKSSLKKDTKDKKATDKLAKIPEINFAGNEDMYRQNESHYQAGMHELRNLPNESVGQQKFNLAADKLKDKVRSYLQEDLLSMVPTLRKGQLPDYGKYVDNYGKDGHLTFDQFQEIYMNHVHYADAQNRHVPQKLEEKQKNDLRRLFKLINEQDNNRLTKEQFVKFLKDGKEANFIERLKIKLKRGKQRLLTCLNEEFMEADMKFGLQGYIPLPVFQTIVGDYDCPLSEDGRKDLKEHKKGFYQVDGQKNEYIDYKALLNFVQPPPKFNLQTLTNAVVIIQSFFRRWKAQQHVKYLKKLQLEQDDFDVRNNLDDINLKKDKKANLPLNDQKMREALAKKKGQQKLTEEQKRQISEENQAKNTAQRKKDTGLEKKMAANLKTSRDPKAIERANKIRAETIEYVQSVIIESLITKAFAYGESLQVCREIQKKYENRPVTKFVYPLSQDFTLQTQGVCSKSLQAFNNLGQIMYLNAQNQLQQFDVAAKKNLAPVSLGTRPPLKHYDIIDMVIDQKSGRIYTINSNWILEIWNIEQNASFPQKRIAVCSNEGGKDFINLYYKNNFNDAKPRFLCLQESNQQVLVVNTTCVDGSIVFIDPISFSILKKIQLRYTDYEVSFKVRKAIKNIKEIFNRLQKKFNYTFSQVIKSIVNPETQAINNADLVQRLSDLDSSLSLPDLWETVYQLDEDQNGEISIDEFFLYFKQGNDQEEDDEYHRAQEEQLMQDESYPTWVLEQGQLAQAQTILLAIYNQLEKQGMTAEQVFQFRDFENSGLITVDDFKRIVKIFLSEVVPEGEKLEFVLRLTKQQTDSRILYREFCKLLTKKFVRTFKLAGTNQAEDEQSSKKKSALEIELDRPMVKEANLSYILRKAAELEIDLRDLLKKADPLELSVISRVNFWGIMLSLPLGLHEHELTEVFDNELNFDNNGNVDYMSIINSDIFVAVERRRIAAKILKKKDPADSTESKSNSKERLSDNRKVVVEDLIFIDDLEIIIYTTIRPKTSLIFVTSMCKPKVEKQQIFDKDNQKAQIIELRDIDSKNVQESLRQIKERREQQAQELMKVQQTNFPLIAKLKGHRNNYAPSISYIAHSNCLVSAEKNDSGNHHLKNPSANQRNDDPAAPINPMMQKSQRTGYSDYSYKHNQSSTEKCEILVWHLQKSMINAFSANYPWNVAPHKRWSAHDASIIDLCYLPKCQLLVSCALDQTIRFWDPVAQAYELTDPSNNPHAQMKPGYYRPLLKEQTKSNMTFKEVKRVYCGSETNCFALRPLTIGGIMLNPKQPEIKSQVEWLVCLKNPQQFNISKEQQRKNRVGIICGYGIERVKIEVPAKHVDDIVPPYIMKECEDLVVQRRLLIVNAFQQHLPVEIERIYSQTMLQNSYMEKIRALFMQAILNRKDDQFVNPEPLREVYKVILKLPARTKFESFLASSGCSDKLSVSETFFYLQKFMQIHPLRTTQIEFEKSIEDFYQRHQRKFLKGIKKHPKQAIQNFADHVRKVGLDIKKLQQDEGGVIKAPKFTTRERLRLYFIDFVDEYKNRIFTDDKIEQILEELDPYNTGAISYDVLTSYFNEEIQFQQNSKDRRPDKIIDLIRHLAFPNHKVALQQSLAAADEAGDGYITQTQFIDAFYRVNLEPKIDRDQLELLFDIMSERFDKPLLNDQSQQKTQDFLNLSFFFSRLFHKGEDAAVSEVDQTMQMIKAAMIYKGVDFGIVFAEKTAEDTKQTQKGKRDQRRKQATQDDKIDLMCHYSRFALQICKKDFVERVLQLNATNVTRDRVIRLANYLSLNQKAQSVIYLNTWLHHLRRVSTQFQTPIDKVLPIMCSKLLKNEQVFRSMIENFAGLKSKRDEDKLVELADLRLVLKKFGISYINQNMFLNYFSKGVNLRLDDLLTSMKSKIKEHYGDSHNESHQTPAQLLTLADLQKTDYFKILQEKIKQRKEDGLEDINVAAVLQKMQEFDESDSSQIPAYKLVNVLKYQLPEDLLSEETLIGIQYELECLNHEHLVDYHEFIKIFLQGSSKEKRMSQLELTQKKSTYSQQDYEDLLGKIKDSSDKDTILRIFEVFSKKSDGFISYEDLRKVIQLIDYPITDRQFELLTLYADESSQGNIHAYDLAQQIANAETVSPQFKINKWITAASDSFKDGKYNILEIVNLSLPRLRKRFNLDYGDGKPGHDCVVVTGNQFRDVIYDVCPEFRKKTANQEELHNLIDYAIRGSQRSKQEGEGKQPINYEKDLIHLGYFEKSIDQVISQMRKADIKKKQDQLNQTLTESTAKQELDKERNKLKEKVDKQTKQLTKEQSDRENQLIEKVNSIFREREVSFYDAFQQDYDPLLETNIISIQKFKELVRMLNLNTLTVQDHRVMRRIADPEQIGKVDLKIFCYRFDNDICLRNIRRDQTLDKIAVEFFTNNFNLKKAFQLFDTDGNCLISRQDFRRAFATLDIGVKYDEINDLMQLVDTNKDGKLNYDAFITKLNASISSRYKRLYRLIEDKVFTKIDGVINHSGDENPLYHAMLTYDIDNTHHIEARDLTRVFKRLGLQSVEPHMPMVVLAGGVNPELEDEKINIVQFHNVFTKELQRRKKKNSMMRIQAITKLYSMLQNLGISMFDFFVRLDTNRSSKVSKLEFKTGIQAMNITLNREEFESLWSLLHQDQKSVQVVPITRKLKVDTLRPVEATISYYDLIQGFIQSGALKFTKTIDKTDILIAQFRKQMKEPKGINSTVEKLYKLYDPQEVRVVFRNEFIDTSKLIGFEFEDEEFEAIFEAFATHGIKKEPGQQFDRAQVTRFTFKQMQDVLTVQKDENWIYNAYIKINKAVLQKGLTYKKLFSQWKGQQKANQDTKALIKLQEKDIAAGLKKLKAGLTNDEIDKIVAQLKYDPKDKAISDKDFEETVLTGAHKLQNERSHDNMILIEWIKEFEGQLQRNFATIEQLFYEYDSRQEGNLLFEDFANMNEAIGVSMNKKRTNKIFELIDRQNNKKLMLEEIKNILVQKNLYEEEPEMEMQDDWNIKETGLKKSKDILERYKVNELYEEMKNKIESKNITLEQIFFTDLKLDPQALITVEAMKDGFAKLQLNLSVEEGKKILKDVRHFYNDRFEVTLRNLVDFMTKKKINLVYAEKGAIDPLLANTVSAVNRIKDRFELKLEDLFNMLDSRGVGCITKENFVVGVQGMNLPCSNEDITELFNTLNDDCSTITKKVFVEKMSYYTSKMSGPTMIDSSKGSKQNGGEKDKEENKKKKQPNLQVVYQTLKELTEAIQERELTLKSLITTMDYQKSGYLSRPDFTSFIHSIAKKVPLEKLRELTEFLDSSDSGKISILAFSKLVLDCFNSNIGGGLYSQIQMQPIIHKIISELSVDCDRFFDEVADKNQNFIETELKTQKDFNSTEYSLQKTGLSKSIFLNELNRYGVTLNDKETALLSTVFSLENKKQRDMLDYQKLDIMFEGVQQTLYCQKTQYTVDWERRVFKQIGDHLMRNNISIHEMFNKVDTDLSATVSLGELKYAIEKMPEVKLTTNQLAAFLNRLASRQGEDGNQSTSQYISYNEFVQRFWAAYTYDDVFEDEDHLKEVQKMKDKDNKKKRNEEIQMPPAVNLSSHNISEANEKMKQLLEEKVIQYRMFKSVQKRFKDLFPTPRQAYEKLDTDDQGFLVLRDFQINLSKHFNLSLKALEVRALFQNIDYDDNGIIKYEEIEAFYDCDFKAKVEEMQRNKKERTIYNEIFDHLIKILHQKGITLIDVFKEIDENRNGYIEVQEFHDMLERMGFTIKYHQVIALIKSMDEDFDGRITYQEFCGHLERLGFDITKIKHNEIEDEVEYLRTTGMLKEIKSSNSHQWRDKAFELLIKTIYKRLEKMKSPEESTFYDIGPKKNKKNQMTVEQYFTQYDADHDGYLAPSEFRKACLDLKEPMLKSTQIERILHIVIEERKLKPLCSIERINKLIHDYKYLSVGEAVLIDEDLFVFIVEKYDGISRMMEFINNLTDKSTYLQRHTYELSMRGLNMMSNQKAVDKLKHKSNFLNELFQSTMVLLAGNITRLMKEEALLTVLDPSKNIDNIVTDENKGVLDSFDVPTIENSTFDVNFQSLTYLPCGAQRYKGTLMTTKEPIEILQFPTEGLQYVSLDGKKFEKHLVTELQIHRYLMGARFEEEDEMDNPNAFADEDLDIFPNLGKFEKKVGLSVSDKEVYVINKSIDEDKWINLDDFVVKNGGILNIPLFYHTEAPLYIIRHWAKLILQIIQKVHDVSVVLRCLNTKQLWISRDGKQVRLGHVRGAGRVNNLGFLKTCPDIYLHLENNERSTTGGDNKSTNISPSKNLGASSRRTNNDQPRMFSNKALDTPFIPPEVLFSKFSDHTSAMDVWAFGMILFCLMFGRRPVSYYTIYRKWLKKTHNKDVELGSLPFTKPSNSNFIYDPFSIDFENPFDNVNMDDLAATHFKQKMSLEEIESQHRPQDGVLNFQNFMKCISDLSYSGMFTAENSKKYDYQRIVPDPKAEKNKNDEDYKYNDIHNLEARKQREEREKDRLAQQLKEKEKQGHKIDRKEEDRQIAISKMLDKSGYRFPGQNTSQKSVRNQFLAAMAKVEVLERKNELGLILDLIASCLDVDPKKRPTIQGLLHSPIFFLDQHERTNAIRFSQNVILYRSPLSSVCSAITTPLRAICAETLKGPMNVYEHTENILKLFLRVEDAIQYNTALPIDELSQVMTESEKRKGITAAMAARGVDASKLRVSPNGPLAAQVVEDKVIDMLLFLTFRYLKNFKTFKKKEIEALDQRIELAKKQEMQEQKEKTAESVTQGGETSKTGKSSGSCPYHGHKEVKKAMEKLENTVLQRMTHLLRTIVHQMHSYNTPMAPHVNEVIQYIVKFFIGEESMFGSDVVLNRTCTNKHNQLKAFLNERSFFRRESELNATFKSDPADKLWSLEQKNKTFLDKSNYWCPELYNESLKIYRDAITESGKGQSCYPVICDFITSISNSFEPTKIFSMQMSQLSMSFLIPMNRTSAYYNELIPIAESLSRLYDPNLEKAGKRCSLAMVRSVFQTGNSDKIKACLDMRVPKHLVHYILDSDEQVRKECLFTYLEISKGLQDDDFEVIGKHAANLKREFAKQGYTRTAFDLHKAMSMASQSEVLDAQAKIDKINETNRRKGASQTNAANRGKQSRQKGQDQDVDQSEAQCNYIKRTIALIEKNENEKYINFALDLPNLNFLASKRFLKEMAVCFESPVFIAPLVRLMKTQTEQHSNKSIILDIFQNLVCGPQRVLIALNSPACDTYMTLLKNLMMNTKMIFAKNNPNSSQVTTQMRQTLALQDKVKKLFMYMFEQRRPTIIKDLQCIGASATLLNEQELSIPDDIDLPTLVNFFDEEAERPYIAADQIIIDGPRGYIKHIKELRCWVKHFYAVSLIPELTRIKAMQRCMNQLIRVVKVVWREYFKYDPAPQKKEMNMSQKDKDELHQKAMRKIEYMELIRMVLSFFDWLCVNNRYQFLFNEDSGRCNLAFVINMCNMILCQFRKPNTCTIDQKDTSLPVMPDQTVINFSFKQSIDYKIEDRDPVPTLQDVTYDERRNKAVQDKHKYDIFPFTDISSILQNIQYQLVRKNDPFLNMLLSEANFGHVFGEQVLLDLDFIRHCIDNCVESLVLMDSYVKKNEIRLNTFEYIIRSEEDTLKDQLIKSNFCERVFEDYIQDFREFNIQFSKIDLEFLAFRRSYPLRLEAISLFNTSLMLKQFAPQIYNEFLMYSRRHQLVKRELDRLQQCVAVNSKEATCLLIFAILLESNESDLLYVMVQEGAHRVIRSLMQEQPSLNKRFPVLRQFINKF